MRSFDEAVTILGGKTRQKVDHNTYVEQLAPNEIGVRLYDTIIVRYFRNGSTRLYSGGFQTVTTKKRIEEFSPCRVNQKKGRWFVNGVEFQEGIEVGQPQTQTLFGFLR